MDERGPVSAGVAVYRDPAPAGSSKLTLFSPDPLEDWSAVAAELGERFGSTGEPEVRSSHAVIVVEAEAPEAESWIRSSHPNLRVMSAGRSGRSIPLIATPYFRRGYDSGGLES